MKAFAKISLIAAFAFAACVSAASAAPVTTAQATSLATTATGYDSADDVQYVTVGNYVANWGARAEDCVFLSTYAQSFYTGSYAYTALSENNGGTSQSDAPSSALYSALQDMMVARHKKITGYQETRYMYCYTDCERSDYKYISSFYSGATLSGTWDSGSTWNREHTWPNSKCIDTNKANDSADLMMLRPTSVSENSSRGNKAYGESSGYYVPEESVRGDCARIVLYVYVRWGNVSKMWGTSGVMENLSVLLKWMEADPVDTWEMGRNDAVQAITGTRNVFVDYPEYAWLLFGEEVPEDMCTPSGLAKSGEAGGSGEDSTSDSTSEKPELPDSGSQDSGTGETPDSNGSASESGCEHEYSDWIVLKEATATEDGRRVRTCFRCGDTIEETIGKTSDGGSVSINCNAALLGNGAGFLLLTAASVFVHKKRKDI